MLKYLLALSLLMPTLASAQDVVTLEGATLRQLVIQLTGWSGDEINISVGNLPRVLVRVDKEEITEERITHRQLTEDRNGTVVYTGIAYDTTQVVVDVIETEVFRDATLKDLVSSWVAAEEKKNARVLEENLARARSAKIDSFTATLRR
jgi:hypothetical protein